MGQFCDLAAVRLVRQNRQGYRERKGGELFGDRHVGSKIVYDD
jgi:hypothetical protein